MMGILKHFFKLNLKYCTVWKDENLDLSFDNKRRYIVCMSVCVIINSLKVAQITLKRASVSVVLNNKQLSVQDKHVILSSLLYRACCFNLFFIVSTHALHYTLKH
jgi:hypothetical protein